VENLGWGGGGRGVTLLDCNNRLLSLGLSNTKSGGIDRLLRVHVIVYHIEEHLYMRLRLVEPTHHPEGAIEQVFISLPDCGHSRNDGMVGPLVGRQ